jgi:tryptophan synthase alpha chain
VTVGTQATAVSNQKFAPSRVAGAFARCKEEGRAALIPFITAGYPSLEMSEKLIAALVAGGADVLEIGVPFSDPLADGTTVQATSQKSLERGTTLDDCFELVRKARHQGIDIPLLLMGYTNPFYQYGIERLARTAAETGVDGFLVPDLPSDESEEFAGPLREHGRDLVFFLAPTSTEGRIRDVASRATGFIYCVALTGITGARDRVSDELPAYIKRVRRETDLPLTVGFGISTPDHVRQVSAIADGVVVASALINYLDTIPEDQQADAATAYVRSMADATVKSPASNGNKAEERA